jgi:hypothetical protein
MRDLNFFLPYTQPNKESKKSNIALLVLGCIFAVYVLGTSIWFFSYRTILNGDINDYKSDIKNSSLQNKYNSAETSIKKYDLLNKYNDGINTTYTVIDSKSIVSSSMINTIISTLPKDVFFTTISVGDGTVQIQCASESRVSIAEFEHNLMKLDMLTNVEVSGLSADTTKNKYSFTAKCTLKGVDKK